jgi:hypothetical protein
MFDLFGFLVSLTAGVIYTTHYHRWERGAGSLQKTPSK